MKADTNQSTEKIEELIAAFILMLRLGRNLKDTCKSHIKVIGKWWHHKNDQTATSHIISINKYETDK